jgi:hypothetical protein
MRVDTSVAGSGNTAVLLAQRVEDVREFAGQNIVFSFFAKASASASMTTGISQYFGPSGSSPVEVTTTGSASLTTSWQRFTFTASMPSLSGKTIGAGNYLEMQLRFPTAATFTIDIWGVQLESGSTATAFRRNANSIEGELAACQRYYYRVNQVGSGFGPIAIGWAKSTTTADIFVQPSSQMRTTPSSVDFSTLRLSGVSNSPAVSTLVISSESNANMVKLAIGGSGFTSGGVYHLGANNSTAAFLGLSAEL